MSLTEVDWSQLPTPQDDGGAAHLTGLALPSLALPSTDGGAVDLGALTGRVVIYTYPMTARPDVAPPDGWDGIPGARGCTPQSCAFRDHAAELEELGVSALYGVSSQDTAYQAEAVARLHLPFPLLSDEGLRLTEALRLPVMEVEGKTLIKRMAWIVEDGVIAKVFYPVFPPDRNAGDVVDWLRGA